MAEHDDTQRLQRVDVRAFEKNLDRISAAGPRRTSFLVTCNDEMLAGIRPPPRARESPRRSGALRGRIKLAPDFDTLSPDVPDAMESGTG